MPLSLLAVLSCFQFSMWDSRGWLPSLSRWLTSFNSLCEILRWRALGISNKFVFQFPMWDSAYRSPRTRLSDSSSFNSLCEIQEITKVLTWTCPRCAFNSLCEIHASKLRKLLRRFMRLSILYVRFSKLGTLIPASQATSFNSLCEIPQQVQALVAGLNNPRFQFSMWDSEIIESLQEITDTQLSILYVRFPVK